MRLKLPSRGMADPPYVERAGFRSQPIGIAYSFALPTDLQ